MLRICQIKILGKEDLSGAPVEGAQVGVNDNYRTTMGYDEATKAINVRIEKIVRPELSREEGVELSYTVIAERSFTEKDFPKPTDNMSWVVDFDVATETIKDPISILDYTKQFASYDDNAHLNIYTYVDQRFNFNLLPLFVLEDFYKETTGFDTTIITYYVDGNTTISPTNWTQQGSIAKTVVKEVEYREKNSWNATMRTNVFFEILNEDGTIDGEANVTPAINIRPDYLNNPVDAPAQGAAKILGNQFEVNLPKSSQYKVRVNYFNMLQDKTPSVRFDVRCINGVSSKDRLTSGIKAGQTALDYSHIDSAVETFINEVSNHLVGNTEGYVNFNYTKFAGYDTLVVSNQLEVGDQIRLKLDCGAQTSYGELIINLV